MPVEARSTAILQTPTVTPVYNRLDGTVSPTHPEYMLMIRNNALNNTHVMQSTGIGTTIMACGPPSPGLDTLTFNRNFLTKNPSYAHKELGVPYLGGVFSYENAVLWRALP